MGWVENQLTLWRDKPVRVNSRGSEPIVNNFIIPYLIEGKTINPSNDHRAATHKLRIVSSVSMKLVQRGSPV
jgi:hypothetical protein